MREEYLLTKLAFHEVAPYVNKKATDLNYEILNKFNFKLKQANLI